MSQQLPAASFKPKSEWKDEEDASLLFVYLPGYAVEKLTITPDYSKGTVKVEGNRRLPSNKLLLLDETFNIPEHSDLSKMDKQFGPGLLTLKIPKSIVVPRQQQTSKQTMEEHQSQTPKPQETVADFMSDKAAMEEQISVKRAAKTDDEAKPESPDEAAMDEKTSAVKDAKSDEEKLVDDTNASSVDKPEESPEAKNLVQDNVGMKVDDKGKGQSRKESSAAVTDSAMNVGKFKEKIRRKGQKWGHSSKGNPEAYKGNEDKKLIVNTGLAILICTGLALFLLYTVGVFMIGLSFHSQRSV